MRTILSLILLLAPISSFALDTENYGRIVEIKSWGKYVDVYFEDKKVHQCENNAHKQRFRSDSENKQHVSFLLSAFAAGKSVSLSYDCDDEGYPLIKGVRIKQ